ncbi:MAG TPA: transporter substrate-binding domain-containing protein [Thermoanaerobaculia bacterium]|jgi:hypothetical protein|nr:transporter substrate-binding domain-containing protein [Thermoanaerobaculia bacterium]
MSKGFRETTVSYLLAATALAALLTPAARADQAPPFKTIKEDTLQVCLYWGFPPFAIRKDTDWQGWDVAYLKKFANVNGIKNFVVIPKDFNDIWLEPGLGHCDIAGTGISDTEARRKQTAGKGVEWSNTYYHVLRSFNVRTADFTQLTRIEDLRGRKAIVTQGSTAHSDLCYRLRSAGLHPCKKADGDHTCTLFPGLDASDERSREEDPFCVFIEYPRNKQEKCAAADIANNKISPDDKDPGVPYAYGGGYGSVQDLSCGGGSGNDDCSYGEQTLATVWPHCNMAGDGIGYAEPFSFVVRAEDTGLAKALNCFIQDQKNYPYAGTPIPVLSPQCPTPPWTPPFTPDPTCNN